MGQDSSSAALLTISMEMPRVLQQVEEKSAAFEVVRMSALKLDPDTPYDTPNKCGFSICK